MAKNSIISIGKKEKKFFSNKRLISVIFNGKVVMKIIAGSDGKNAEKVADLIKDGWPIDIHRAYDIAVYHEFGTYDTLVVMTKAGTEYLGIDPIEGFSDIYRKTFSNPEFDPSKNLKTSDNVIIIEVL